MANNWTRVWEPTQKVPYAYHGNQWVGYDDPESINIKTRYVVEKNLGGLMVWSLDTDDFHGKSGTSYPLLRAISSGLLKSEEPDSSMMKYLERLNCCKSLISTNSKNLK